MAYINGKETWFSPVVDNKALAALIERSATHIGIPSGITTIGERAFHCCENLTSVTIPNGVTSIGEYAFYECTALASADMPNSVLTIGENAFRKCGFIKLPVMNGVTTIGDNSFRLCSNLASIVLPDSVESIGDSSFHECTAVTEVRSGNGLTSIGSQAFRNLTACLLYDFSKCTTVPSLGSSAFSGINTNAKIIVPAALLNEWKAATNWASYSAYITTGV